MGMDRRNKDKMSRPGMIWSEKYLLWMDPDTHSPKRKKLDDMIAVEIEARFKKEPPRE